MNSARTDLVFPLVSFSGTPKSRLVDDNRTARRAVLMAIEEIKQAEPNMRDFSPEDYNRARDQHVARLEALESVASDLYRIAIHCNE